MSGERPEDRATKDRLVKDQVDSGVRADVAETKARAAMRRRDQLLEERRR